ncbi:MAG TPA: VWA domain-containing protein [Sandaracinaceae bacterium]
MQARGLLAFGLALAAAGCGSVFVEGAPARVTARASATIDARDAEGRLVIVEQAPDQGFVVEHGSAEYLASLEGRASVSVHGSSAAGAASSWTSGGADDVAVAGGTSATSTAVVVDGGSLGASGSAVGAGAGGPGVSRSGAAIAGGTSASGVAIIGGGTLAETASGASPASGAGASASSSVVAASAGGGSSGAGAAGVAVGPSASAVGVASATPGASIEVRAEVPRSGVWGLDGRPTALTALDGPGVQVDGVRVRLSDLEALSDLALPAAPSSELATDGSVRAWAELEHDALPRAGGETHIVVRVRAPEATAVPRGRVRVHLVIDRSSSMQRSWDRVLAAARMLIRQLSPDDELQIVAYGTDAIEARAVARVGDGRAAIAALEQISVGGGTNIEAGLELAYRAAARAPRDARALVLLLSDGVPNHGAFEPAELGAQVAAARNAGVTTSVIGLGTEFDARLLRTIAREGRGGYYVAARIETLADELLAELDAHARVAARHLAVRVALPNDVELVEVAGGGAERVEGGVELAMPQLAAGEERSIVLRVRVPAGQRARTVADVSIRYRPGQSDRVVRASSSLELSFGPRAVLRQDGQAGAGVIDAAFAAALDAAGDAILTGNAAAATRALSSHAEWMEGRVEHRHSPVLQARARVVRRLATAVGALLPGSSHAQRRQVALAFGGLAARFAR